MSCSRTSSSFGEYDGPPPPEILDEITTHRLAIGALERLFQKYARAIRD
jgi:hypothetical protein